MAIDSEAKRWSVMSLTNLGLVTLNPDGAIGTNDRADLVGLYQGIALDSPAPEPETTGMGRRQPRKPRWKQ